MSTTSGPALDLAGLVPAVATPMRDGGEVDEAALRAYCRWLLGFPGLKGVAVNMDTGEGPQLLREERRRVLEVWAEEARGRAPVLAGIGAPNTRVACELACDTRDAGAQGVVVFPHPVFVGEPLPADVPRRYHEAIADACGLPIVIFQLQPSLGGVIFSPEALLGLVSLPSVVAIKEASFDAVRFVETQRLLRSAPRRIQMLTGNDNFILESFLLGADGALIGFGTLAVAEQLEMLRRLRAGDLEGARAVYDDVVKPLADVIFAPPVRDYRARVKEALVELGVIPCAAVRPPLLELAEDEKRAVREAVRRARLGAPPGAK